MAEAKRTPGPLPTPPSAPTTPLNRRLNLDVGDEKDVPTVEPLALGPAPAVILSEEATQLRPLAKMLVGALGLASEADIFKSTAVGEDWSDYFDEKFSLAIGKSLSDISEYGIDIWQVAQNRKACVHFASMVQYHYSWDKISVKGTYRQKEAAAYIQNRYEEALAFFKDVNL